MRTQAIYSGTVRTLQGDSMVCFIVPDNKLAEFEKLAPKVSIEVDDFKGKRSLDSNKYLWKLCQLIGDKLGGVDKEVVYKMMLSRYGQFEDINCSNEASKRVKSLFKYFEIFNEDFINDGSTVMIRGYFGSSGYTQSEMNTLLNGVVQEAKDLGIETMSDDELERLISLWKPKRD